MIDPSYETMLAKPVPSKEENMALIKKIEADHREEDIWKLVTNNARVVADVLGRKFIHITDETFSDGLQGFFHAVKRLKDIQHNGQFLTYSKKCIF